MKNRLYYYELEWVKACIEKKRKNDGSYIYHTIIKHKTSDITMDYTFDSLEDALQEILSYAEIGEEDF